jgi:hypothetical protein
MCAVASGSWGGRRPSLAPYVAVTGTTGGGAVGGAKIGFAPLKLASRH